VPVAFACPRCSARLRIDDALAGRRVRCRACTEVVIAPIESSDPGFRIVEREPDPEALGALLAPRPSGRRLGRKIGIRVAAGIVVVAVGIVGWFYLFPSSPIPELVSELPDGDFVVYRTSKGISFFPPEALPFGDTKETATVFRAGKSLTVHAGDFTPPSIGSDLLSRGYVVDSSKVERLYVYPRSEEAVWVSRTRILSGPPPLVLEALEAREGRAKRFLQGLTPAQRRTLGRLPRGNWMWLSKSPGVEERTRMSTMTRGLLASAPAGSQGAGASLRSTSPEEAAFSYVVGYGAGDDEPRTRAALGGFEEWLENLRIDCRGRVASATGRLRRSLVECRVNEAEAVGALRALLRSEYEFQEHDRDRNGVRDFWTGDVSGLHRLRVAGAPLALIEEGIACADAAPLSDEARLGPPLHARPHRGYFFAVLNRGASGEPFAIDTDRSGWAVHHLSTFAFCAFPERHGVSGERTLIINAVGEVYGQDLKGKAVRAWPGQPESEGWKRVP